jgi:hypothetical protein
MGEERRDKSVQGFGEKARRKETSWKTEALMGGWDQNISWETGWRGGWIGFSWIRIGTGGGLL